MRTWAALASALLLIPAGARAQEASTSAQPNDPSRFALDPIVITATRQPQSLMDSPASVSVVEKGDIQEAQATVSLAEPLDRVPGVFVQDSGNYAQDVRIQIRGFGTRAAFGIREIKVLVDGLPETLPDGQTQLDGLDLDSVQRIEVLRGPASSLYGNASGGVIQFFTEDGPDTPEANVRLLGGSYGLGKYAVKGGGTAGAARLFVQGSYLEVGGYREQSASRTGLINAKLRYDFAPQTSGTLLLNAYGSPEAQDPGGLTTAEVHANRRQARKLNVDLDAGEEVQQIRLGGTMSHHSGPHEVSGYAYALYRDFDNNLPILADKGDGVVTFTRVSPGGGARYVYSAPVATLNQQFALGFDAQYQDDDRSRFLNESGQRGARTLHQYERVTGFGPYFREAIFITPAVEISGGLRYDLVDFSVDPDFSIQPLDAAGGARNFNHLSPGGGILYTPRPWLSLFANVGTAFQVPTTTELDNPDGPGLNPTLQPQEATSYEFGVHSDAQRISGGASMYYIDVTNELIPFESTSGRTAFRNAGRSARAGFEVEAQVFPLPGLRWSSSATVLDTRFIDYQVGGRDFAGNEEPGIPPWQVYQELTYAHPSGLYTALEAFFVGGYFVDDANTSRSLGYEVVNLRLGYSGQVAGFTLSPFLGFNNITNSLHDGTVRLNALGGRYYEPAAGFNVFGGIGVTKQLL